MSTSKKIIITYATAGIGHKKASLAIKAALEKKNTEADIKIIDVLDYTKPFFKKSYPYIYLLLINRLSFLWGFFYYMLDIKFLNFLFSLQRRLMHVLNSPNLIKYLVENRPDIVVSTHFLMPDICAYVAKKYKIKTKVIQVVTDYRAHAFWISDAVTTYIVAHEDTRRDLVSKWGIKPEMIKIMGIPVEPKFSIKHEKAFFRSKFGLSRDSFVVSLIGGGYGVGPFLEILEALNKTDIPLSVITVCGHNKPLYDKVARFKTRGEMHIKNYTYVNNVNEIMGASDVYIGKAGGISTTEALAMDLPAIFINPIPGQESRNAKLFTKNGAAIRVRKVSDITGVIQHLKSSSVKMNLLKEGIKKIRKITAAEDIADFVIESLPK